MTRLVRCFLHPIIFLNVFTISQCFLSFQAQQQGISAVLNVLDTDSTDGVPAVSRSNDRANSVENSISKVKTAPVQKYREVISKTENSRSPLVRNTMADDAPTDVSVTLSSSDGPHKPNADKPDEVPTDVTRTENPAIRSALAELKQLRSAKGVRRFLRMNPTVEQKGTESHLQPSAANRPFSSLIDALKQMNGELGGSQKTTPVHSDGKAKQFRLLQFPSPVVHDFPVKLPRVFPVPKPITAFVPPANDVTERVHFIPELHQPYMSGNAPESNPPDDYLLRLNMIRSRFENAVADNTSDELPFPMLRLVDSNSHRKPFFVPPEDIILRNRSGLDERDNASNRPLSTAWDSPQLLKLDKEPIKTRDAAVEKQT